MSKSKNIILPLKNVKLTKTLLFTTFFLLQAYLIRFSIGSYPSNLQEILIGITALTFIVESLKERSLLTSIKNIKKHWVLISLAVLTLISTIFVPIKENVDFIRHLKFLFFAIVLTFIFLETFKTNEQRKKAIKFAGFGAIVFGIFSIIYNLAGSNVTHDYRLIGPLDSAVYLAYYLTPFFIFFTLEFLEKKEKSKLIPVIILGALIIATKSMGAIGGGFLVILISILIRKNKKFFKSKNTKIALAIAFLAVVGIIFYTKILPTIQTSYSSLDERGEIWQTSALLLKDIKTFFLGLGLGQFQYYYKFYVDLAIGHSPLDYHVLQPHNIFLLFFFHYGVLGLGFIVFCITKTIKAIFRLPYKLDIKSISLFIILYFFIHGLIDTPFFKNDLLIMFILFLELGLISSPKPNPSELNRDR